MFVLLYFFSFFFYLFLMVPFSFKSLHWSYFINKGCHHFTLFSLSHVTHTPMFTMWNLVSHNPDNFITTSSILYKSLKLQTEKRKKNKKKEF
jgi:hypothetical protein